MIGSACASQNTHLQKTDIIGVETDDQTEDAVICTVNTDDSDESSQNNDKQDIISQSDDNAIINQSNNEEIISDTQKEVKTTGKEKIELDAKIQPRYLPTDEYAYFKVFVQKDAAKDISISIDGKTIEEKIIVDEDLDPILEFDIQKRGLSLGKHNLTFSHLGNSKYAPLSKTYALNIVYFNAYIPKTNWGDEYYIVGELTNYENGKLTLLVDGKVRKTYDASILRDDDGIYMPDVSWGVHDVELRYDGILGNDSIKGKYECRYLSMSIEEGMHVDWETRDVYVYADYKFTNQVTAKIGGKTIKCNVKKGDGTFTINKNLFKIGKNTITLSYKGDKKYPAYTYKVTFNVFPTIICPEEVSYKDKDSIVVLQPTGTQSKYILYSVADNDDHKKSKIKSGSLEGNFIQLPKLKTGEHHLKLTLTYSNGFTYTTDYWLTVKKNTPGFSFKISKKTVKIGEKIKMKIKSPKLNTKAIISVDGKKVKSVNLKKGKVNFDYKILTPGKHKVKILISKGKKFYSKALMVTVKPKYTLTLKKVNVKKSAKKLVLTAKVKKTNGKAIKNKKVTFKFNGKAYKSKTNKKGVAKLTIKKSVLSKLKVGGKVKITATYGVLTVKNTAKIKR